MMLRHEVWSQAISVRWLKGMNHALPNTARETFACHLHLRLSQKPCVPTRPGEQAFWGTQKCRIQPTAREGVTQPR